MKRYFPILMLTVSASCSQQTTPTAHTETVDPLSSDYVTRLEEMEAIQAGLGENIHLLRGDQHGFRNLSFILAETAPGGGPPLHTHESEEAHILRDGKMEYVLGKDRFVVSAPYVLRVPAGVPHTFINAGTSPLKLTAVFDSSHYTFKPLAKNPLQPHQHVDHK